MNFPENLRYTKEHEWILLEGGTATVGITEYAQQELGDIVYVDIEVQDKALSAGDVFGTIEAVKTVSDLNMPVAGSVTEVNSVLEGSPEKVNSSPYNEGWLVKMKVDNPTDVTSLLDADAYQKLIS